MRTIRSAYLSTARADLTESDIREIARKSSEKNADLGIHGMLCYRDGAIFQVLEGPEPIVNELLDTIRNDPRHHDMSVVTTEEILVPLFSTWTMGSCFTSNAKTTSPRELEAVKTYFEYCKTLDGAALIIGLLQYFTGEGRGFIDHRKVA